MLDQIVNKLVIEAERRADAELTPLSAPSGKADEKATAPAAVDSATQTKDQIETESVGLEPALKKRRVEKLSKSTDSDSKDATGSSGDDTEMAGESTLNAKDGKDQKQEDSTKNQSASKEQEEEEEDDEAVDGSKLGVHLLPGHIKQEILNEHLRAGNNWQRTTEQREACFSVDSQLNCLGCSVDATKV